MLFGTYEIPPLPFEDGSAEVVHCSHTLEHLRKQDAIDLIRDCYRVLEPGGVLTLAVPDMDIFINAHLSNNWSWANEAALALQNMNQCLGGEFDKDDPWAHKFMWCWESLAHILEKSGYVEIERHGHDDSRHKHLFPNAYNVDFAGCSLYVDAMKPVI